MSYLLRLSCICHVCLKMKRGNFNYGNELYCEWQEPHTCLQLPTVSFISSPALPLALNSFTPKALESIISLVYTRITRIKCPVIICTVGEERTGGKNTRDVKKQFGGSKIKVFHRNQYGNTKEKPVQ